MGGYTKSVSGQRLFKHVPRQQLRMQQEWTVLSTRSVPRSYKEENWGNPVSYVQDLSTEAEQ
jgi:hypothetical protein